MSAADTGPILSPVISKPGEGQTHVTLGQQVIVKIPSAATGGTHYVCEIVVPPGSGTPLHVHSLEDETFFVLEGGFQFIVAGQEIEVAAGATLFAPRHVEHNFTNVTDQPARLLCVCTPGANMESFFAALGAIPLDRQVDEVVGLCNRHGMAV